MVEFDEVIKKKRNNMQQSWEELTLKRLNKQYEE